MRKYGRIDSNHNTIVATLRATGCSVQSLASVGSGCPDLLVGRNGVNVLMEVKDGEKPQSRRLLTPDEEQWISEWRGKAFVVYDADDALAVMNSEIKQ